MAGTIIGLKELHYAKLTQDDVSDVLYAAPVRIIGAIQANINPNPSIDSLFADDGPMDTTTALGQIALEMIAKDFPMEIQADILGHTISGGVMQRNADDVPPWVAIGFKSLKSNGYYRYVWLLKGKFMVPDMTHETKKDSINFQTPTLKGNFVKRENDGLWVKQTDEDYVDYTSDIGSNWFSGVESATDSAAPTVTIAPVDEATDVAIGTTVVWTFNKAIQASCVSASNFMLLDSSSDLVAGSLSVNAGHTIVTFTPTSDLADSTVHTAIATTGVKSAAGVALAAASVTTFTTAA